ncbi:MAG: AtpZ/AtpI family protein [Deltaproteobacteria bacterium]|nr:AtpZ/AtpI family protein [Deltaproteobacteria bacterium]MBW2385334.1 AtpZ/AtpI family protein [Deltaproteobacteria bacterium]MBW2697056.1 AtpZ/AtpI family protein [Deltaproteobacteria bacterium]
MTRETRETRGRTHRGECRESGSHANRVGEVDEVAESSAKTGTSRRKAVDTGLPGRRRLQKVAGSTRSVEGSAYQGAVEATFAIVIAALLGYWADQQFGTSPLWLIVGVVVGFAAFVMRLMRMAKLVQDPHPEPGSEEEPREREGR